MNIDVDTKSDSLLFSEVMNPADIEIEDLPDEADELADKEQLKDAGTAFEEKLPGENDGIPQARLIEITAQRVTEVSDTIVTGALNLGADSPPALLIPRHRDRLRVTLSRGDTDTSAPIPLIGYGHDLTPNTGYRLNIGQELTLATRAPIYVMTGTGTNSCTVQWIIELIAR